MNTFIGVTTSFKATHNWPEAGKVAGHQVAFLENEHRHTFHVTVETQVFHDERDIEFYVLQRQVNMIISGLYGDLWDGTAMRLGRKSCETISKDILSGLQRQYPRLGKTTVKVSEDNEVWAYTTYEP